MFLKVEFSFFYFSCVDDKVCVVGIFGKDNLGYKSKAVHLNGTIGKEVFKVCFILPVENGHALWIPLVVEHLFFARHDRIQSMAL